MDATEVLLQVLKSVVEGIDQRNLSGQEKNAIIP
jgi:hypothetical protein